MSMASWQQFIPWTKSSPPSLQTGPIQTLLTSGTFILKSFNSSSSSWWSTFATITKAESLD